MTSPPCWFCDDDPNEERMVSAWCPTGFIRAYESCALLAARWLLAVTIDPRAGEQQRVSAEAATTEANALEAMYQSAGAEAEAAQQGKEAMTRRALLEALLASRRLTKGAWRVSRMLRPHPTTDAKELQRHTRREARASYLNEKQHLLACQIAIELGEDFIAQILNDHDSNPPKPDALD